MSTMQQDQRKRYRVGEVVGVISYPDGETKALKRAIVDEIEGRGMHLREVDGGKKRFFAYFNRVEKIEPELPAKARPIIEAVRTRPVVPEVRADAVPVAIAKPWSTPALAVPVDVLSDFADLITMGEEIARNLVVRQAEIRESLKAAKTERDLIDRDIETLEAEHRALDGKVEALKKLGAAR